MSPSFEDIFKNDPDKSFIINYAPLFANLSVSEKNLIIKKSKVVEYNKGDIIYRQLDEPDAFYCVISGRVRISVVTDGKKETLEYLNYGNYFGIISLLTGDPHSVNAEAANDSKVLRIAKEDFQIILDRIPRLALDLSRTLSRRLRKKDIRGKRIFESSIISVADITRGQERLLYANHLALSLKKETGKSIILINVFENAKPTGEALSLQEGYFLTDEAIKKTTLQDADSGISILNTSYDSLRTSDYAANFNFLLTSLACDFRFIIIYLPVFASASGFKILNQSDIIHVIADCARDSLQNTKALITELIQKVKCPQEQIKVIANADREGEYLSCEEASKLLGYTIYAALPEGPRVAKKTILEEPVTEYAKTIRRIAREAGDVRVGLALSGGAAFGLAHIGVIKVLEKENIPIDVVATASMGAVVGALWAAGLNSSKLERVALELNNNKKKVFHLLVDPVFPKLSFFGGRSIRRLLEKYIGKKTFEDARFPLKVVACNLTKREKVVYDSGNICDAVMASLALPGIFSPAKINGDLLIDGGIIEPVPIGTLLQMGIKKIIAVNVFPSPEDIARGYELNLKRAEEEKKKAKAKGFFARVMYNIGTRINKIFFPNVFDIIVNSIQVMEYVIAERDCMMMDVVLRPASPGVDWFELFKAEELIKVGVEETNNALPQIKALISE